MSEPNHESRTTSDAPEPLTDAEMQELANSPIWEPDHSIGLVHTGRQVKWLIAEIRRLWKEVAVLETTEAEGTLALEAENAKLRETLEEIEFCVEHSGAHWCPSCRGNKQKGAPTRGHYAHCPIYAALKGGDYGPEDQKTK